MIISSPLFEAYLAISRLGTFGRRSLEGHEDMRGGRACLNY
jgi:hypothetical protein